MGFLVELFFLIDFLHEAAPSKYTIKYLLLLHPYSQREKE